MGRKGSGARQGLRLLLIEFVSLTEGVDTTTPAGKMVFTVSGAVAELERSLIRERVRAGLRNERAKGKPIGRPRVKADIAHILDLRAQGCRGLPLARTLGLAKEPFGDSVWHRLKFWHSRQRRMIDASICRAFRRFQRAVVL